MYYTQKHATSPGSWPAGGRLFATTIALVTVAVIAAGCSSSGSDTKPGPGAVDPASGISEATMKVDQAGGVQGWKSPGPAFDVSQAKGKTVYFVGLSSAIPVVQTLASPNPAKRRRLAGKTARPQRPRERFFAGDPPILPTWLAAPRAGEAVCLWRARRLLSRSPRPGNEALAAQRR